MVNLNEYYSQQAGTGIAFYPGVRYQKGHGFFGRFFKGNLLPLLQSLGHKLLSTGVDVADDVINNDIDPMTSLRKRGKIAAKGAANELISSARSKLSAMNQTGSGKRKRKKKSIKGASAEKSLISKGAFVKKTSKRTSMKGPKKRRSKKGSKRVSRRVPKKTLKRKHRKTKRKTSKRVSSKRIVPKFLEI